MNTDNRNRKVNLPYSVILTGGICSGKSTVAKMFHQYGIDIIDADKIAREIVKPHQSGWKAIKNHFGEAFFLPDEQLNRPLLRQKIFSDLNAKKQLEKLLHPLIQTEIEQKQQQSGSEYILLDIPLFVENPNRYSYNRVLVVDVKTLTQRQRLIKRDSCTVEEAQAIIDSQSSREERLAMADDVIFNEKEHNGIGLSALEQQVKKLHLQYLELAKTC